MADYKKADYWQSLARKEGYPARSVYKLKEMDEKFGLLKGAGRAGFRILDVGAAPGSWSLYILRKLAGKGFLAAVDLSPLSREFDKGLFDGGNFFFVQGDFTQAAALEAVACRGPYSLILSDAAPSTTGNGAVDAARSFDLAQAVTDCAEKNLAPGGSLLIKVFQSADSADLLKRFKGLFGTAKTFKPKACRSESFEVYFIGTGKKG
ncbi:MAG: RlmE family RNA methyltransferase [Spirochaetes bacterium]|nr:RlmE family RNA methyltransferase [Spirochaetota bacterium]